MHTTMRVVFIAYVLFLTGCALIAGSWGGIFGFMAAAAAGLPWSLFALSGQVRLFSDGTYTALFWGGAALNIVFLGYVVNAAKRVEMELQKPESNVSEK